MPDALIYFLKNFLKSYFEGPLPNYNGFSFSKQETSWLFPMMMPWPNDVESCYFTVADNLFLTKIFKHLFEAISKVLCWNYETYFHLKKLLLFCQPEYDIDQSTIDSTYYRIMVMVFTTVQAVVLTDSEKYLHGLDFFLKWQEEGASTNLLISKIYLKQVLEGKY